jgi:hypothetical protein
MTHHWVRLVYNLTIGNRWPITHHPLTVVPLVRSVSRKVLVGFDSDGVWRPLVFLSDELSSEPECIGRSLLLRLLLILLHNV